jgi:hypothetical protein
MSLILPARAPSIRCEIKHPVGRLVPLAAFPNRLLEKPLVPSGENGSGEGNTAQQQLADAITLGELGCWVTKVKEEWYVRASS